MTIAVREIIETFDALPDADKHEVAVTILQRYSGAIEGDIPSETLVEAADELFQTLDSEEATDAPR